MKMKKCSIIEENHKKRMRGMLMLYENEIRILKQRIRESEKKIERLRKVEFRLGNHRSRYFQVNNQHLEVSGVYWRGLTLKQPEEESGRANSWKQGQEQKVEQVIQRIQYKRNQLENSVDELFVEIQKLYIKGSE